MQKWLFSRMPSLKRIARAAWKIATYVLFMAAREQTTFYRFFCFTEIVPCNTKRIPRLFSEGRIVCNFPSAKQSSSEVNPLTAENATIFFKFVVKREIPGRELAKLLGRKDEDMHVISNFLWECMPELCNGILKIDGILIYQNPDIQVTLVSIGSSCPWPIKTNRFCSWKVGKMFVHKENIHEAFQFDGDRRRYPRYSSPFSFT